MLNILVVDDDENTLIAQEALLENAGYHTTTAWGAAAGRKELESRTFDLILIDDYLPGTDSASLTRRAREANVPVVVLSSMRLPPEVRLNGCETVHKWTPFDVRRKVDHILKDCETRFMPLAA